MLSIWVMMVGRMGWCGVHLGLGPQNWGQSPIRGGTRDKTNSVWPNWDPTPNLLRLSVYGENLNAKVRSPRALRWQLNPGLAHLRFPRRMRQFCTLGACGSGLRGVGT